MRKLLLTALTILLTYPLWAQNNQDTLRGLQAETLLHPTEGFTAYTYQKGEVFYAQNLVPFPGFAQIGVTDWLTVELPFWEWFGQVMSINLRFKLAEQNKLLPALAYETQYQYLPKEIDLLEGAPGIAAIRKGHNWFHRINASWRLTPSFMLHLSAGVTYAEYLEFSNKDSVNFISEAYKNQTSPDISLAIDWRAKPWISFGSSASYGTTYMYIDNTARKQQFTIGTRLAPFYKNRWGVLKHFRIELVIFSMKFGNIPTRITSPYGFIYWQWHFKKKK